jgi:hypothetical protein
MLLWRHTEFTVKCVMPDFLHIIPILNDAMLDGLLDSKDSALLLSLVTDIDLLLIETDHDAGHLRAANNC